MTRKRRTRGSVPSYRKHKPTGQAVVTLNGRDHYLGPHGSRASVQEYDALIHEWLVNGRRLPDESLTINELIVLYIEHAESYFRKDDRETSQVARIRAALRFVQPAYGRLQPAEFGPLKLKACREAMIAAGLTRYTCNSYAGEIRRMFKWGNSCELVNVEVWRALTSVADLRAGRTEAREMPRVLPVPWEFVEPLRDLLPPQIWAMIRLQDLTGMRPGEVCLIRGIDLDVSGKVWFYYPERHKNEHHETPREIGIGPQAQVVLKPFLKTGVEAYLFSPADVEEQRRADLRATRKTRVQPSQQNRRKREPKRQPGEKYTTASYRRAIHRAIKRLNEQREKLGDEEVPQWGPHRLRHNAATRARKLKDLDTARAVCGHAKADTTEIYAERDRELAVDYLLQHG